MKPLHRGVFVHAFHESDSRDPRSKETAGCYAKKEMVEALELKKVNS